MVFRQRKAGPSLLCLGGRSDGMRLQGDLYGAKPAERCALLCAGEKPAAPALPFVVRFHLHSFGFSSLEEIQAENPVLAINATCKPFFPSKGCSVAWWVMELQLVRW